MCGAREGWFRAHFAGDVTGFADGVRTFAG